MSTGTSPSSESEDEFKWIRLRFVTQEARWIEMEWVWIYLFIVSYGPVFFSLVKFSSTEGQ